MTPMEIGTTVVLGIVTLVAGYSALQTSRLDTAFDSIAEVRVQVATTGKDVEYIRRDMDEIKALVTSIDGKLASADPLKKPTTYAVKDIGGFSEYMRKVNAEGPLYIFSDDPSTEDLIQTYIKNQ
ncbi:hypothetical protein [Dongia sp.]|uniref:hypothetical protein n=1 Tax=Dongia sp. TaxID=1977262 RepID=UPI0035B15C81